MIDPLENSLLDIPEYENIEDEAFPPFPPPLSPGQSGDGDLFANGELRDGESSGLADAPPPKRRVVKRPQPKLDANRLVSERGLPALRNLFDDVRFKGRGHELENLHLLVQKMQNWSHRLYPKLQFDDFVDKLESLGTKREVQACLTKIRLDLPIMHDDFIGNDGEEAGPSEAHCPDEPDPFEAVVLGDEPPVHSTPATASLTEEQWRRIELNKQLALERRLARTQHPPDASTSSSSPLHTQTQEDPDEPLLLQTASPPSSQNPPLPKLNGRDGDSD